MNKAVESRSFNPCQPHINHVMDEDEIAFASALGLDIATLRQDTMEVWNQSHSLYCKGWCIKGLTMRLCKRVAFNLPVR